MGRLSNDHEGQILDVIARDYPAEADLLRVHLREMRSDQWARELVERVVEAITEGRYATLDTVRSLERLEQAIKAHQMADDERLRPLVTRVADLIAAEARRFDAQAASLREAEGRAKMRGEDLRVIVKQAGKVLTSPPFMLVWGGVALWLVQRLGVAAETLRIFGGMP